ncbi:UNVERIFIED_CONTAM: protein E6 [Sesamum radiatum]|uniref:Protein E6 n=1 Tax=Sesamum radiatum TaxID=300843 RepID=A0AAW2K290_SESRA
MAASYTNHFSLLLLLLLLTLLSSLHTHARDSQYFNKVSSSTTTTTTNAAVPNTKELPTNQQAEPNFLPENENSYGLYGHESGQLPPSTTTTTESKQPSHKYLPKNYNPVAYVTQPEDVTRRSRTEFRSYPGATTNNRNYHYNGGSSFNSQPQELSETRFRGGATSSIRRNNYYNNGGEANYGFQPQGMSDTRFLENGKYYYDVNTEKYSSNHPYETLKRGQARNEYSNRNYYGNSENAYEFSNRDNSMGGYQNQEEFQQEENDLP